MDTLAPESTRQNLRSQRLNLLTNEPHQRLESLVKSKEPLTLEFHSVSLWLNLIISSAREHGTCLFSSLFSTLFRQI